MNPYDYNNTVINYNTSLIETTPHWRRYAVDFPTAHPTRHEKNNTVRGEYFRPRGIEKAPLAILVHGMGDYGAVPCKFLARTLARQGTACFVLYQVFHSSRLPESQKDRIYELSPEEWFESYRISVIDVRQVIDWARQVPEIDPEQIAVIGISFGGFVSSIAMAIDERIKAGVFLVSGGNSGKMVWQGRRRYLKRWHANTTEVEYNHAQSQYRAYLDEVAGKGFENVTPLRQEFLNDPMTFAHLLKRRPVLMINAQWDGAVPRDCTRDFWEECGRPEITWFPSGHPSLWLWYPLITRRIRRFLNKALDSVS